MFNPLSLLCSHVRLYLDCNTLLLVLGHLEQVKSSDGAVMYSCFNTLFSLSIHNTRHYCHHADRFVVSRVFYDDRYHYHVARLYHSGYPVKWGSWKVWLYPFWQVSSK